MKEPIYKQNGKPQNVQIFFAIICFLGMIYLIFNPLFDDYRLSGFEEFLNYALPVLMAFGTCSSLVYFIVSRKSYIKIYEDHIEGNGMNFPFFFAYLKQFNLKTGHYTVTRNNNMICIHGYSEKIYMIFEAYAVDKVYQILYDGPEKKKELTQIHKADLVLDAEKKRIYCPNCGIAFNANIGKDRTSMTCPECQQRFEVNV